MPKIDYKTAIAPIHTPKAKHSPYHIFVATPVHSDVSIHYCQGLIVFQGECFKKGIKVTFQIMKSSLVTQGRNLCVGEFLSNETATHLLFVDSDIEFNPDTVWKMLEYDKEVISAPYPLKTVNWEKAYNKVKNGEIKNKKDLENSIYSYPLKIDDSNNIKIDKKTPGLIEVSHSPTGCMLIKKQVFNKMIKAYPDKGIVQKTVINGELVEKANMWNFFDTLHDPIEKTYLGEDFAFCKLWKDIGGKCYAYVDHPITHVGEFKYEGRFADELILNK